MSKYSFWFFLKQSFTGLIKNALMSITSVFILMACLILMGCFSLLIYNASVNLDSIKLFNKVMVRVDNGLTPEQEQEVDAKIRALENVKSIEFVPRDQALAETRSKLLKEYQSTADMFKGANNHMHNYYNLEYEDIDNIDTYVYQLGAIENIYVRDKITEAKKLRSMMKFISFILFWFLIILLIISVFIILNTIKLSVHTRKNEITLMRYIGATNGFIMFPFLLEGMLIGGIAACLAFFIQQYIYTIVQNSIMNVEFEFILVKFNEVGLLILSGFLIVGVMSGLIGSSLSARKYLRA